MIRRFFKNRTPNKKVSAIIEKYKIPYNYICINRRSVANAFLVGIFFAMIPMPMQMLAVILCMPFLTFNIPIALSLVWITNPFTMPFIFYVEYLFGNLILMQDHHLNVRMSVEWLQEHIGDIFIPLYVGAFTTAILLSLSSRYLLIQLWKHSVYKERNQRTH
jgi:uncharacterized protein